MKQIFILILTTFLLCKIFVPATLAADVNEPEYNLVQTTTSSAIILTCFDEPYRTDAVAFATHTLQEEISKWFADSITGFTGYDANGTPYDLISGTWSLDAVNTSTSGVYYVSTKPNLGTEYTLADGVTLPHQLCAVSIQAPGDPDINCCVSARGFLRFPWVLSDKQQEQLDAFAICLRQDNGEWVQLSEGFCFTSGDLQLSQRIFTYGSTYDLKVTYPGGQTGVLTFQYNGELCIIDYTGGDRDGGDVNGGGSGTGSQPAPIPPQLPSDSTEDDNSSSGSNDTPQDSSSTEVQPDLAPPQIPDSSQNSETLNNANNSPVQTPAAPIESAVPVYSVITLSHDAEDILPETGNDAVFQPKDVAKAVIKQVPDNNNTPQEKISVVHERAAISESYSPTQTTISGVRLRDLCANEESVVFGSGNLTISIPSNLLLAMNLSDSDTLSVTFTQPKSNQIMLAVEVCGKPVTELRGTILRLRYMPHRDNTEITVLNEAGKQIADASYDGEFVHFRADTTGTYKILEMSKKQEEQKGGLPLSLILGGLILATGGILFFRRKRHG